MGYMKTHPNPPIVTVTRKARASGCMSVRRRLLGGIERCGQILLLVVIARAFPEARAADTGGAMPSDQIALGVLAEEVVDKQILRDDHVALQTHHLGDVGDAA